MNYKQPSNKIPHDLYGYIPMELDVILDKRKFKRKWNNQKGKVLKCYACGMLGYMMRDCYSKNKVH